MYTTVCYSYYFYRPYQWHAEIKYNLINFFFLCFQFGQIINYNVFYLSKCIRKQIYYLNPPQKLGIKSPM